MRKVLFCLSLIISLSVLGAVPSFAMDFTLDPATIGSIGDLGYGLAGGMELDFNDSFLASKYKGEYSAEGTSQGKRLVAQKAANDFITNYAISRGLPLPSDASEYVENLPTDTYSYFKSVYFDNQTRSITNKAKLAGNDAALLSDALRFGIGPSAFADWATYNSFWYNKFQSIGEVEESDQPETFLPDQYSYAAVLGTTLIGSNNFDVSAHDFSVGSYNPLTFLGDWSDTAIYTSATNGFTNVFDGTVRINLTFYKAGYLEIYYSSENSMWYLNDTHFAENTLSTDVFTNGIGNYYNDFVNCRYATNFNNTIRPYGAAQFYNTWNGNVRSYIDLDGALNYALQHYRNCDVYVNGQLWVFGGGSIDQAPANPVIPSFPDVIDPTSDDPAYTIDLPLTDTGDGYFDLTSLFDALVDAIEGALDDDPTTDGVLDGTKGLEYEDEEGDAVDDDPIPDDDVIDDSIPDPTGYPNIPVPLPPIQDAFSGTTVLAELVHATDVVMPDDLMSVFWGIVFILFIIGLIKVLHK